MYSLNKIRFNVGEIFYSQGISLSGLLTVVRELKTAGTIPRRLNMGDAQCQISIKDAV